MLNLWCTMEPASTLSIGRKSNAATSPPAADTSLWTSAATLVGAGFVRTTKLVATTLFMSCVNSLSSCAVGTKRSEEHTSELQSRLHLVCRLLLEKKKTLQRQSHRFGGGHARSSDCLGRTRGLP